MRKFLKLSLVLLNLTLLFSLFCFAADFDGYIVRIKENTAESIAVNTFSEVSLMSDMSDSEVVSLLSDELCDVSEISSEHMLVRADDENALDTLLDLGIVESYEYDYYFTLFESDEADNPYYSNQWYIDTINADYAWKMGVYGNGVNVAVIDSGVIKHNDIVENLVDGINYNSENGSTCNTDNNRHGSGVAGIIAASCNDLGIVGISYRSKIVPIRVMDRWNNAKLSYIITAIYDAVDVYECQVLNLSVGANTDSNELHNAVKYAVNNGAIVVAASGNTADDSTNNNAPQYPACYSEVISVANAGKSGTGFVISNSSTYNEFVDITAPGTSVYTLENIQDSYAYRNGTSFSCPMVSAAAALVKSVDPSITYSEFKYLLKSSADASYITEAQGSDYWGAGMLDIEKLLKMLIGDNKVYVSDIQSAESEDFVYITNPGRNDIFDCSVVLTQYDGDGAVIKTETIEMDFSSDTTVKLSLTAKGYDANSTVSVYYSYVPGDVNGDGSISVKDASAILKHLAGYEVSLISAALDVNGDGSVSSKDASAILKYIAGYDVVLH